MQDEVLELCCIAWSYREQRSVGERVDLLLQDNKIKLKNKQVRLLMSPCSPDRIQAQPPVGGDIGFSWEEQAEEFKLPPPLLP